MTTPKEIQSENIRRYAKWMKIALWTFVLGGCVLFLIEGHVMRIESGSGGLGYGASLFVAVIVVGPIVLLWFLLELLVWAIWLRMITKGLGIAAPFIFLWWFCLATGQSLGDIAPGIVFTLLLALFLVLGYIGIVRRRAREETRNSISGPY